jgi:hypothetical protein
VQFVRGKAEIKSVRELLPTDFAILPESLRQNLVDALIMLDSEYILEAIEKIEAIAPELATVLREKAENFDYENILKPLLDLVDFAKIKN